MNVDEYETKLRKERSHVPGMVAFLLIALMLATVDLVLTWTFWSRLLQ